MENKKQQKGSSSSSSITSQLFGPQESDVLASIFPPSKGAGRNEVRGTWHNEPSGSGNQPLNAKQDKTYKQGANKERGCIYQQEGVEPSYLSSSIYYGGQEMYSSLTTHQNSSSYPQYKKDGEDDDYNGAARGNWWQGSLYY